jgi:Inner membrane component domain
MRLILNLIWLVLCGWWLAILYALAGLICFVLIITIPFGIAAFRTTRTINGEHSGFWVGYGYCSALNTPKSQKSPR